MSQKEQSGKKTNNFKLLPNLDQSLSQAHNLIRILLNHIGQYIQEQEILSHLPQYSCNVTMLALIDLINIYSIPEPSHPTIAAQVENVAKIPMENFAPKQIKRQTVSLSVEKSTSNSKPNSIKLKSKPSKISSRENSSDSPLKIDKPLPTVVPLPQEEDDQNIQLITQMRRQKMFLAEQKKRVDEVLKAHKRQLQQRHNTLRAKFTGEYTFDLDGSLLKSQLADTNQKSVHVMRLNLNRIQNLKVKDPLQVEKQNVMIVATRRKDKDRYRTAEILDQQKQPPLFADSVIKSDRSTNKYLNVKKSEYSHLYGNRFNPWNETPNSKAPPKNREDSFQTLDLVVSQRGSSIRSNRVRRNPRRPGSTVLPSGFTLPKLRGKYDLLERYRSLENSSATSKAC